MTNNIEKLQILDEIITGRVSPHIYAFTTNTVPNYLKVGDTYRPVSMRLREWERYYPTLEKAFEKKAVVTDDVYFRDFAVHQFLEQELQKRRLESTDIQSGVYFSREFFENTTPQDVEKGISDIVEQYKEGTGKYTYYDSSNRLPENYKYKRGPVWKLRPNQQNAVNNFKQAILTGRTNLLMYAVMRFGKSFTSLCCAQSINAKIILIVSAKADVKEEWKKTVESAGNFDGYVFLSTEELSRDEDAIQEALNKNKAAVIFLTLQDLQGKQIKDKHKEIFNSRIDLLIVDETHFGARAQEYGRVLKDARQKVDDKKTLEKTDDDKVSIDEAEVQIKSLNAKVRLHLSGTPYRILMGSEFEKEDVISFVQFVDIVNEKEEWDKENLADDNVNEWDNPYYGFPQMVRFAFRPNKSSIQKMEALKNTGVTFAFSALFEPCSIKLDKENKQHKKFRHQKEIIDLLKVIDGSKNDEGLLGFLDYNKLKEGKMCRHMVMVLPYCGSCDAMEELIKVNKKEFKNLNEYEVINISGVEGSKSYKDPNAVKNKIREYENVNQKTLTLTVNRMLTGSTVEEWDTMLYFKDTSSPQEYDQAIFRLQNQYTRELVSEKGLIRENLKPQTLLVDFDPNRMFYMQEQKSLVYNANAELNGNSKLKERLKEELRISPIITMNENKLEQVEATNILDKVSAYNNQRSIFDEVNDIPVDMEILSDKDILAIIETQSEFGSKGGLSFKPFEESEEVDLDIDEPNKDTSPNEKTGNDINPTREKDEEKRLEKRIQTYYQRILFFAFLSKEHVASLSEIVHIIEDGDNARLATNLGLNKSILQKMNQLINTFKLNNLDYKIQNISKLSNDENINPLDRAITSFKKFNRMSESEVVTPPDVCDNMIALIPEEGLRRIIKDGKKFLDIASKSGEYAVGFYKRLTKDLGFSKEQIADKIYSIPTSSIAYEFTRRFYEILGLNIENISSKFTAYDLLKIKEESNNTVCFLMKENKKFNKITLNEKISKGDDIVKFGAIVGNPPYHESDGGAQASARPIYQEFVQIAKSLDPEYMSFIIPTRWFAGGKGLDKFRDQMLEDLTLKELHDFLTPEVIFPDTNNRGGVCYFISDKNHNAEEEFTKIVSHNGNGIISESNRRLKTDGLDIFIRDNIGLHIMEKVNKDKSFSTISDFISPRKPFGIEGNFVNNEKFYPIAKTLKNPVKCYGKAKNIGFIEKSEVLNRQAWIDCWKVYTPYANNIGTELNDDNQNTFIGEPGSVCTETFLVIGAELNLTEIEASNLGLYLRTKFARFLHSLPKVSQHGTRQTYRFVPHQDFTDASDIDWSKALDEVDEQLFSKYSLNDEEKHHIRQSIKDMV